MLVSVGSSTRLGSFPAPYLAGRAIRAVADRSPAVRDTGVISRQRRPVASGRAVLLHRVLGGGYENDNR
jgi:hypothetical protein